MVFSAGILAATVALIVLIPKCFLPTEDTDQLNVTTEAIEGIS
jgi:HAE1 family hydrophobic/amphiphilic exporter-1